MSQLNQTLTLPAAPELVFGLVAPIGVDLDLVTEVLEQTLQEVGYVARWSGPRFDRTGGIA
jgi:hypothetical protein